MVRVFRSRARSAGYSGGTARTYVGTTLTGTISPTRTYNSNCSDWHGRPVADSPFTSSQYKGTYPHIDGTLHGQGAYSTYKAVYEAFTPAALPTAMTTMSPLSAPSGWMLDLVAGTNPSRPVLNIPELVEDLVDLPKALKAAGDAILHPTKLIKPRRFAGEYLGVQFGWLPLIEDLQKIANFTDYAVKRSKELDDLYSGNGMRRRLKFDDDTTETAVPMSFSGPPLMVGTLNCSLRIKRKTWATIHWYPTSPPPYHPDDSSKSHLLNRLVFGLTPEGLANGLWKVIPWTWLIGWFTNIGKYTLANSWTVPATHSSGCFMSYAEATLVAGGVTATNTPDRLTSDGQAKLEIRTRIVGTQVTVGANMPFLDMFRLSILGALFVQRFVGR